MSAAAHGARCQPSTMAAELDRAPISDDGSDDEATGAEASPDAPPNAPLAPAYPLYLAGVSFTPYVRRRCADAGYADPGAPRTCEASVQFRERLHAHVLDVERREGEFARWIADRDARGKGAACFATAAAAATNKNKQQQTKNS